MFLREPQSPKTTVKTTVVPVCFQGAQLERVSVLFISRTGLVLYCSRARLGKVGILRGRSWQRGQWHVNLDRRDRAQRRYAAVTVAAVLTGVPVHRRHRGPDARGSMPRSRRCCQADPCLPTNARRGQIKVLCYWYLDVFDGWG